MNKIDPIREQFERFKQEERTWNYAEALYWMNQYKNFIEQTLAAQPAPIEEVCDSAQTTQATKLVRLTWEEIKALPCQLHCTHIYYNEAVVDEHGAQAWAEQIMDAMERKNLGAQPAVRLQLVKPAYGYGLHIKQWDNLGQLGEGVHLLYVKQGGV